MVLTDLTAISPVDGRYYKTANPLSSYFSEYALIQYRIRIEIEYYIALCELPLPQLKDFKKNKFSDLRDIYQKFTEEDAKKVKEIGRASCRERV